MTFKTKTPSLGVSLLRNTCNFFFINCNDWECRRLGAIKSVEPMAIKRGGGIHRRNRDVKLVDHKRAPQGPQVPGAASPCGLSGSDWCSWKWRWLVYSLISHLKLWTHVLYTTRVLFDVIDKGMVKRFSLHHCWQQLLAAFLRGFWFM